MNTASRPLLLFVCLAAAWGQDAPSLSGTVTDPSGAALPGAVVQLRGPGGEKGAVTGDSGRYSFMALKPGKYQIRLTAKNFSAVQKKDLAIDRAKVVDVQMAIQADAQVIRVEDALGGVRTDPDSNRSAVILGTRQIGELSDDPDELALQLQALAGPAPGPDGGQFYVDGFVAGGLPPKSAIREVRINANPFSPEYDKPGFGRVEIFTKPGSDSFHGQAFGMFDNQLLNARNPLLTQQARPPYQVVLEGLSLSGPLQKKRASFSFDTEHREVHDNALVLATTLDANLNPVPISQAIASPQSRTALSPRLDYTINAKNTLVVRYQDIQANSDNQGVGDFNLASRAYNERQTERLMQATETAVLSPRSMNETRFQFLRSTDQDITNNAVPSIVVLGAFNAGGPPGRNSGVVTNAWELTNISTYTLKRHTLKWGGRVRQTLLADTSLNNFSGTFTFFTLAQYQATLALHGGASQFSLNAGTPTTHVHQEDAGLFVNDDWRLRPNLTLSYGLRYEVQSNLGGWTDWAPRVGLAWGIDAKGSRPATWVVRSGFGTFYDRIPLTVTLNRLRYNGTTQQSYLIMNPTFFPSVPPASVLESGSQPQQLRPVASGIQAPRLYQASAGIERRLNQSSYVSLTWTGSRGVHLLNSRNINAPIAGLYPFGDPSIRLLTESAGLSSRNQVVLNANANYRKFSLFGYYTLSYGRDDNEGIPANPYDLRAEWGPSTYGNGRHRMAAGMTFSLPEKFIVSPFLVANSGVPYNITTGLDPYNTGYPEARPSLVAGGTAASCQGAGLQYEAGFGCFHLNPTAGSAAIERNFGIGPANWNMALRLSRSWSFGRESRAGASPGQDASPHPGGPPMGPVEPVASHRYQFTFTASTLNALNHPNFAAPDGDLSSPYFGQSRSLGGLIVLMHGGAPTTYNRKIDLQLRFTF
ncbi:MAG TPA: carboxypeptidase regulatory-like domain-containing protein [Bryobacteraceae bacterium]|nr:carboxypeptidase regulatory-like domain-containing protein [Bryobacteraceae bacterium]